MPTTELPVENEIIEYQLVIRLPEAVEKKIRSFRERLCQKHGIKQVEELPLQLTVMHCYAFRKVGERLTERLRQLAFSQAPFSIEFRTFSAWPPHSIFLEAAPQAAFGELVRNLQPLRWMMNIPQLEPEFLDEARLVWARQLKPMPFISLWMDCEQATMDTCFTAAGLQLLTRVKGAAGWETATILPFQSSPVIPEQAQLFA